MVTFTAADDRRQSYAANQARRAVNAARQHEATFGDPNWIMSQSPETMQDRDFMSQAKPAMVAMQGNRDFLTTDKDEKRNLYQMWMNQMKGGDKGARMLDTRGLPAVVQADLGKYRRGSTMFQDPSKSQGFFGDVGSLFTGKNRAAVYADEYNPFPEAGFGADWYKDKFKFASGLGSLMGAAEKYVPYFGALGRMFGKERTPLEQDLSWLLEGVGEYDELPMMEFEDKDVVTDLVEGDPENDLTENFLADEKEEIPFQFNFGELMKDLASIEVNPAKAAQHGFEGSATELWTLAKEQSKQFGHDFSGEEVLERLFKDGWFNPDESIAVGDI